MLMALGPRSPIPLLRPATLGRPPTVASDGSSVCVPGSVPPQLGKSSCLRFSGVCRPGARSAADIIGVRRVQAPRQLLFHRSGMIKDSF
jgi:hypothetical protein